MKKTIITLIAATTLFACKKTDTQPSTTDKLNTIGLSTTARYIYKSDTLQFNSNNTITVTFNGQAITFPVHISTGTHATPYNKVVKVIVQDRLNNGGKTTPTFKALTDTCWIFARMTTYELQRSPYTTLLEIIYNAPVVEVK